MEGLAASVTNKYGSGEGQSTKHHYAGVAKEIKRKKKKKCKGK